MATRTIINLCLATVMFSGLTANVNAQNYYLTKNQGLGWHWNAVNSDQAWYSERTGQQASELDANGVYNTRGFSVRTRDVNNARDVFEGQKLIVDGGAFLLKAGNNTTAEIKHLVARGARFSAATKLQNDNLQVLTIGTLEQSGDTRISADSAGVGYELNVDKLVGDGTITFIGNEAQTARFEVSIKDASGFTGKIILKSGTLRLNAPLSFAGGLVIHSGSALNLTQEITVTSLVIDEEELSARIYAHRDLRSSHSRIFSQGRSSGKINVTGAE